MQDGQTQGPSSVSSYQQFQQQRFMRQEQQAVQAQQAILSAGADSFSQKVMDTVNALRKISGDLAGAQKQLEAQIQAQQRQLLQMQQNIDSVIAQVQNAFKSGSAGGAGSSYLQ